MFGDFDARFVVERHEFLFPGCFNKLGSLLARVILWPLEHPGAGIVENEDSTIVHGVTTGDRSANKMRHYISATRFGCCRTSIRQLSKGVASYAASGEGQCSFLFLGERVRCVLTSKCEWTSWQIHALRESPRPAGKHRIDERDGLRRIGLPIHLESALAIASL